MDVLVASTVFVLIVCILAYRADTRFHSETRLPMQWGLTGEVNWYAPRRLALAFMPAFAIVVLGFFTFTTLNFAPRAGQEGLVFPALIGTGTTLSRYNCSISGCSPRLCARTASKGFSRYRSGRPG
jgi:hypothetical protein